MFDSCEQLWCAALDLAIEDATKPRPKRMPAERPADYARRVNDWHAARDWIGTRDFRHVCALAGVDADAVYDRVQPRMADQ